MKNKSNYWKMLSLLGLSLFGSVPVAGMVYAAIGATLITGGVASFAFACCGIFWSTCCIAVPGVGGIAAGAAVGL